MKNRDLYHSIKKLPVFGNRFDVDRLKWLSYASKRKATSSLAMAWLANKVLEPVRLVLVLALTSRLARYMPSISQRWSAFVRIKPSSASASASTIAATVSSSSEMRKAAAQVTNFEKQKIQTAMNKQPLPQDQQKQETSKIQHPQGKNQQQQQH